MKTSTGLSINRLSGGLPCPARAFSLVELLVVIAMVGVLSALLLPALNRAKSRAAGITCLNNVRQLGLAWILYSDDHEGRLPYNLGGDSTRGTVTTKTNLNWVNNVLTWELDSDNTNLLTITEASLAPYANRSVRIYRCPSDNILSSVQRKAGWTARIRSYSMNAMVGDAGELSRKGYNQNNPGYVQFFRISTIPQPSTIFVFLDEHPDSINDGYFLNRVSRREWVDLPASYHDGAAAFAFADGHAQLQKWADQATKSPAHPDAAKLPRELSKGQSKDFDWVTDHMSIDREKDSKYYHSY